MTSRKTRKAAGRGGRPPRSPPPGGGPPRLHAPALVPVCSAVKASVPPPPCDRAPPSSRSLAETWGAASRRAPGTATRGPRAGVGPQSGDRLLSRCRPQRSSVPRRAVAQKIRFCPEAQPAQPWASYGSAADEGQRETLTPRHRSHVRVGRLLPTSKRPWDAGARPPLHCPRGEKRGPGGSRRLPQSEAAPGGVVGAAAPMWARPLARQQQRDSGPSPHLPPAPLLWSVCGVLLNSRSPSPLQSSSPGSDQHVAIWGSCVIM